MRLDVLVYPFGTNEGRLPPNLMAYVPSLNDRMGMWKSALGELGQGDALVIVQHPRVAGTTQTLVDRLVDHATGLGLKVITYQDRLGFDLKAQLGANHSFVERVRGYGELSPDIYYETWRAALQAGVPFNDLTGKVVLPEHLSIWL
ncbi:hypothetical protein HYV82_04990 [Candidatus Woesearchaeota archaeon]|nr:hypothetical protein [Candidatus Woesearchaeota archaeon]